MSPQSTGVWACFGVRWQAKRDTALERATGVGVSRIVVRAKAPSPLRSAGAVHRARGFAERIWSAAARRRFGCTPGMHRTLNRTHTPGTFWRCSESGDMSPQSTGVWAYFGVRWQAKRDTALERATGVGVSRIMVPAKAPSPLRSAGAVHRGPTHPAWNSGVRFRMFHPHGLSLLG
jgi:hypothetical protein